MSSEIIEQAKSLGVMIQKSKEFDEFKSCKEKMDSDESLNDLRKKFDSYKDELNKEISKEESDKEKIKELSDNLRSVYEQINDTEVVCKYESAKKSLDDLVSKVNKIISESAYGRSESLSFDSCTGICSTCS